MNCCCTGSPLILIVRWLNLQGADFTNPTGDVIVLYDQLEDRFSIISP